MVLSRYVGAEVRRKEDPRLITGSSLYVDDLHLPGMLHAAVLRSPHPHARIVSVDMRAARAVPGVHVVLTGADIGFVGLGRQLQDWPALAVDLCWLLRPSVC